MKITVPRLARDYDHAAVRALLAGKDIIADGFDPATGEFVVQTAVTASVEEAEAVRRHLSTANGVEETLHARAWEAADGLRSIVNSTGPLSATQLSNAVRLLARVALALVRLQLRRLDSADDTAPTATTTAPAQTAQGAKSR